MVQQAHRTVLHGVCIVALLCLLLEIINQHAVIICLDAICRADLMPSTYHRGLANNSTAEDSFPKIQIRTPCKSCSILGNYDLPARCILSIDITLLHSVICSYISIPLRDS
ncbi:hypothetical protein L211DRAFT_142026 [Terfezia boudieri ATCC MYA-4762]|uniref:Secreted protein n=1 Tax=Terfezia boudieri ATCC MYA-4762 TaxID=1051890 RepID=A0A3N4LSL5_9PEZI|nr:hypothetical protein L211DRAFT_142026 [Terfezia boudieri ATCC MYA-4762]